jgi:hypothetical protein
MATINVNAESPVPIWSLVASSSTQLLLVNLDSNANITIGDANVQSLDTSADTIPPQGAMAVPANQSWYAIADIDDNAQLQVTVGGSNWAASPAGIANAIIDAGIPVLIAQELSASGISLLAAPQQLYNIGGVSQPGTGFTSLVGWTVPTQCFKTGCYYASLSGPNQQDAGDSAFQANVGRGLPNNRVPITKKFWNPGDYHTNNNFNNLSKYYSYGTTVIVCLQPLFNSSTNHLQNGEVANVQAFITAITALGATPTNTIFVFWQETQDKITATQYTNGLNDLAATMNASGFPTAMDMATHAGTAGGVTYMNAAFASTLTHSMCAADFYAPAFNNGITLDALANVADAHALPFALFELGVAPGNFPGNPNMASQYFGYITNFFQTRQQNGKANGHFVYYDGQCDANGAGDLSAPILTPTDQRVALYDTMFDTLTVSAGGGTGGITIPNNHTTTLVPTNPSINGGLAPTDQLSYEIALGLTAGVGSTLPFAHVILTWYAFDQQPKNQTIVDTVGFYVPMGTNADPNGPLVIKGRGRQRGSYMTIKVNNFDTVACSLAFLQLMDTARVGTRDAWNWDINAGNSPTVPGFTLGNAASASLEVGRVSAVNINAGATKSFLFGIATGRVYFRLHVNGLTTDQLEFQVQPVPSNIFPATTFYIHMFMGNAIIEYENFFVAARCPLLINLINNAAVAATVDVVMIQEETA